MWFQQDGGTSYTECETPSSLLVVLSVNWSLRSCDRIPLDFFLHYLKEKERDISCAITIIRSGLCERMVLC